jgi:gentisate 1,2-dioxygenase
MNVPLKTPPATDLSPSLRHALKSAHMVPLWESPTAHKLDVEREPAHIWPWAVTRPILTEVGQTKSPRIVERRVLSLVNPKSRGPEDEATTGAINAAMQLLLPGEHARPHRHSMNALRFVLEGSGAETIVDGKACAMDAGDLIITPGGCWHEHVHHGGTPTLWLDVLDVTLHLFLGTDSFQPGPIAVKPVHYDDRMFAVPNITPVVDTARHPHSPVFRYPWASARAAVAEAPSGEDGLRRVRYVNPMTGGSCMSILDCYLIEARPGTFSRPFRTSYSSVCAVAQGSGTSRIGGKEINWTEKDVFTLPAGAWVSHRTTDGPAHIFMVTNRDLYSRLGLLTEECGD